MFKTFPEFSKLTLADREEYEGFIKDFPPVADISFGSLMTWWEGLQGVKVAALNGNLVIQYWLPEEERYSGLALVGTSKVDETICVIFDYLRTHNFPVRLVNTPHFVIDNVAYYSMFNFREQRDFYEYVFELKKFYPINNLIWFRRRKVERQMRHFNNLEFRQLDLEAEDNQKMVLDMVDATWGINPNNFGKLEQNALRTSVFQCKRLGMENLCLFLDNKLQGVCLYQKPHDSDFIILNHIKVGSRKLTGYDLTSHLFAGWFMEQGIKFANVNSDAGVMPLRMLMLALGPTNFFRKYTVEPS